MVYYEMDTPPVHGAGRQVSGLAPVADGLARRFGTVLGTAEGTVGHPVVAAAVRRYADRWQPLASRAAGQVRQLGGATSGSAVTISETDLAAEQILAGTPRHLRRTINAPVVAGL